MTEYLTGKKFFISYLKEDHEIAELINQKLIDLDHKTFFDKRSIGPGDNWVHVIDKEIKECDYFLLLWSSHGEGRLETYVSIELNLARVRHQKKFRATDPFIFPILVGNRVKLPTEFGLDDIQAIKLNEDDLESKISEGLKEILNRTAKGIEKFPINPSYDSNLPKILNNIRDNYTAVISKARNSDLIPPDDFDEFDYQKAILNRTAYIQECTRQTIENNSEAIEESIDSFKEWMINETVVRVIGAGRAKLAATIPANRLAHGGARVYEQDGKIPMPHDIKGGGIIAASASGRTPSVLGVLREIKRKRYFTSSNVARSPFKVIGIAIKDAKEFASLCDVFIGINMLKKQIPLIALADIEESVITLILDSLIVSAGWKAGFDDTRWRLGHENLGATGPYDVTVVPTQPLHSSIKVG